MKNKKTSKIISGIIIIIALIIIYAVTKGGESTDPTQPGTSGTTSSSTFATEESKTTEADSLIDENGVYDSKEDVALYIHVYRHLPKNYITKKEAEKKGWAGGSVEQVLPGYCIGGDYYGNYEGTLPDGEEYHECDIDTLDYKDRGSRRIIYSKSGKIYYTGDHYKTFTELYDGWD